MSTVVMGPQEAGLLATRGEARGFAEPGEIGLTQDGRILEGGAGLRVGGFGVGQCADQQENGETTSCLHGFLTGCLPVLRLGP